MKFWRHDNVSSYFHVKTVLRVDSPWKNWQFVRCSFLVLSIARWRDSALFSTNMKVELGRRWAKRMAKCPPAKRKALDKAVIARWTRTNSRLFSLFRLLLDPHANIQRAKESLSFLWGEDAGDATQYILHKFSTLLKKCCRMQPATSISDNCGKN